MQATFNSDIVYRAAQITGHNVALHSPLGETAMLPRSIPEFNFPAPPF